MQGELKMKKKWLVLIAVMMAVLMLVVSSPVMAGQEFAEFVGFDLPDRLLRQFRSLLRVIKGHLPHFLVG